MTVPSTTSRDQQLGDGVTTVFTVPFRVLSATHMRVLLTVGGVTTELVLTTDFSVSGVGNFSTTVTTTTPPESGALLTFSRNVPATQETDYVPNDPFPAESHERALDKLTMIVQQLEEVAGDNGRAIKIPPQTTGVSTTLPVPVGGGLWGWDAAGTSPRYYSASEIGTALAFSNFIADTFTATAGQTLFTLSADPGAIANLDVSVGGVTQVPGVDYTMEGASITFSTPMAGGEIVLARYGTALPLSSADAANVFFRQAGTGAVPRTVEDELRDRVSIKQFGAVGDGIHDDSPAFVAAATYLHDIGGGTMLIPRGTYRMQSVSCRIGSNTHIKGEPGAKFIRYHNGTLMMNGLGYTTLSNVPAYGGRSNITIEDLILDLNPGMFPDAGSHLALGRGSNITVRRCTFLDQYGNHFIDMAACKDVLIEDCIFKGYDLTSKAADTADALQMDADLEGSFPYFGLPTFMQCKNITVRRCYFGDNPDSTAPNIGAPPIGVGSHASVYDRWQENVIVEDCIFDGMGYAGVRVLKWKDCTVRNNTFTGCVHPLYISGAAAGTESSKDGDRVQTNRGQGNVNLAIAGNMMRGTVTRGIFLIGFSVGDATGAQHDGTTIKDNTIYCAVGDGYCAELRQGKNNLIANNRFYNGVRALFFSTDVCSNTIISDNIFDGASEHAINLGAGSLNTTISGNTFTNVAGRGIHVTGSANNGAAIGNIFNGVALSAIYLQSSSSYWQVSQNQFILTNTSADTDPTPLRAASTCLGVVATDNYIAPGNVGATLPVALYASSGYASFRITGTPAGVVTAPIGSQALNVSGGASTTLYVKESGNGAATGWVAK